MDRKQELGSIDFLTKGLDVAVFSPGLLLFASSLLIFSPKIGAVPALLRLLRRPWPLGTGGEEEEEDKRLRGLLAAAYEDCERKEGGMVEECGQIFFRCSENICYTAGANFSDREKRQWQSLKALLKTQSGVEDASRFPTEVKEKVQVMVVSHLPSPLLLCGVQAGGRLVYLRLLSPVPSDPTIPPPTAMVGAAQLSTPAVVCFRPPSGCNGDPAPPLPSGLLDISPCDLCCLYLLPPPHACCGDSRVLIMTLKQQSGDDIEERSVRGSEAQHLHVEVEVSPPRAPSSRRLLRTCREQQPLPLSSPQTGGIGGRSHQSSPAVVAPFSPSNCLGDRKPRGCYGARERRVVTSSFSSPSRPHADAVLTPETTRKAEPSRSALQRPLSDCPIGTRGRGGPLDSSPVSPPIRLSDMLEFRASPPILSLSPPPSLPRAMALDSAERKVHPVLTTATALSLSAATTVSTASQEGPGLSVGELSDSSPGERSDVGGRRQCLSRNDQQEEEKAQEEVTARPNLDIATPVVGVTTTSSVMERKDEDGGTETGLLALAAKSDVSSSCPCAEGCSDRLSEGQIATIAGGGRGVEVPRPHQVEMGGAARGRGPGGGGRALSLSVPAVGKEEAVNRRGAAATVDAPGVSGMVDSLLWAVMGALTSSSSSSSSGQAGDSVSNSSTCSSNQCSRSSSYNSLVELNVNFPSASVD